MTGYQGGVIDTANLKFEDLLGQIKVIEDKKWADLGAKGDFSGCTIEIMDVSNKTGGPVTPGQAVEMNPEAPFEIQRTAQTINIGAVIVDEFLPAAGCPNNDVCFVVIRGPCTAKLVPGNVADQAGGTYWRGDSTSKGVLVPVVVADDKAIAAFHQAAVGPTWNMITIAKNAGTVDGRVYVRSKYSG